MCINIGDSSEYVENSHTPTLCLLCLVNMQSLLRFCFQNMHNWRVHIQYMKSPFRPMNIAWTMYEIDLEAVHVNWASSLITGHFLMCIDDYPNWLASVQNSFGAVHLCTFSSLFYECALLLRFILLSFICQLTLTLCVVNFGVWIHCEIFQKILLPEFHDIALIRNACT